MGKLGSRATQLIFGTLGLCHCLLVPGFLLLGNTGAAAGQWLDENYDPKWGKNRRRETLNKEVRNSKKEKDYKE